MKKTLIKIMIITLIICTMFCNYTMAEGTDGVQFQLIPSADSAKPGDTIEVVFKATNNTKGIAELSGLLEYDENAFEKLDLEDTTNSFVKGSGWATPEFLENMLDVHTTNLEDVTGDQNIFTIKLKVKSDIKDGKYSVSITDLTTAGNENAKIERVSADINVKTAAVEPPVDNNNTTTNNTTTNSTVNNTTTNNTTNNTTENNTVTNNSSTNTGNVNELPYAGLNNVSLGVAVVVILLAAGTALYKYNKYKSL